VTDIVWLASYPKSGNTWFRMLVANLSAKDAEPIGINGLPERSGIASSRAAFDNILMLESGLFTHEEAACLRPRVYEELARGAAWDPDLDPADDPGHIRFVKVHDAYTLTAMGEPLLAGARGAKAAILIVRDPRDIVASVAHHYRLSIDDAVTALNDRKLTQSSARNHQTLQLRQELLGWSGHSNSWLGQNDIPIHVVRYEDLNSNTAEVFHAAMMFAGRDAPPEAVKMTVELSEFSKLKAQEREKGFKEWVGRRDGQYFFRRGAVGGWRDELTAEQVRRIEQEHGPTMRQFGYELFTETSIAKAGQRGTAVMPG
jgi:hypothetical protein